MNDQRISAAATHGASISINKVLKNTYLLLSMTLIFSGIMAFAGIALGIGFGAALVADIAAIVLLWFVLPRTAQSAAGIGVMFAMTGLLGFGLAPTISHYLAVNPAIVSTALGGTGAIFLGLSAYALMTRRDFSFLGGFVFAGVLVVLAAIVANIFLQMPIMFLVINAAIVMLMTAMILWETSRIVNGGETNYIMAAAGLFIAIINMFQALMHLLGVLDD